jgi:hypothetical protein
MELSISEPFKVAKSATKREGLVVPLTGQELRATARASPLGDEYRLAIARQLFSPALLAGRDLPHGSDLAVLLGVILDQLVKIAWAEGVHLLSHPLHVLSRGEFGGDGKWKGTGGTRGGDFSVEVELDGACLLPLNVGRLHWWRKRISRVTWPDDTALGLFFVPDLITAWQVDLGRLSAHPRVVASKGNLLLKKGQLAARKKRRQRLFGRERLEGEAWGAKQETNQLLHLVELKEVRRFDSLMSGLIVRDGAFDPGVRPDREGQPSLATEAYRAFENELNQIDPRDPFLFLVHPRIKHDQESGEELPDPEPQDRSESLSASALLDFRDRERELASFLDELTPTQRRLVEELDRFNPDDVRGGEHPNDVLGRRMEIEPSTVRVHKHKIREKLEARQKKARDV